MKKICSIAKHKDVYDLPLEQFKSGSWLKGFVIDQDILLDITYNIETQKLTVASRDVRTVKEEIHNGNATSFTATDKTTDD